jgi:hypothetical protein
MNLYTIDEFSKKIKYSKHTIYKKKELLTNGVHYFQQPKGKILFCDEAISFFLNIKKGVHSESIKRNCIQEKRESISIHKYFNQ